MSPKEQEILLRLARDSIATSFSGVEPDMQDSSHLSEELGAFVTLHENGQLRGCIGYPEPVMPLCQAVARLARAAAFDDPRFPALRKEELNQIEIEISVLTRPGLLDAKPAEYAKHIKIGRDGLIIRGLGQGLLLPQVAPEQGWDVHDFLEGICIKAGQPPGSWKDPSNRIYTFQAEVFSEKDINK